jgi:DNA helicase-2/ATP-dependent DNA helicase PcrA
MNEMEEERRLMYVGITRAKEKVHLLYTRERTIFGSLQINSPSRFVDDIPMQLLDDLSATDKSFPHQGLRNKTDESHDTQAEKYVDGDKVEHPVFGPGTVVSSQGDILTIAFSKAGLKKLSASIAPLKKKG